MIFYLLLSLLSYSSMAMQAQPVPIPEDKSINPQFEISGVGIGTAGLATDRAGSSGSSQKGKSQISFADSSLVFGAAERLYQDSYTGSFALGFTTLDSANAGIGNPFFLHQALVDLQGKKWEFLVGRSDLVSAHLLDFPLLRGTDLLNFTQAPNPFSDGTNDEEQRYGNIASATWNHELKYFYGAHAEHLVHSVNTSHTSDINAVGLRFEYLANPGREAVERWQTVGINYDYLPAQSSTPNIHQVSLGGSLNLIQSVVNRFILNIQEVVNHGSNLATLASYQDSFIANSFATAVSLRYLSSPFGGTRKQIGLTLAQKHYPQVYRGDSYAISLLASQSLGEGFDLVSQYKREMRQSGLAAPFNSVKHEDTIELGLLFNFNVAFNQHLLPRRNLLKMENMYEPE